MSIGKSHALLTEFVEMRGGNFGFGIISAHVTVSHVVNEDDQNMW